MSRSCTVCAHKEVGAINGALVGGVSCRELALLHRLGPDALERHKAGHLPKAMVRAQEAQEMAQADTLLGQVRALQERTLTILSRAEASRDGQLALGAVREARGNLQLLAKLTGELDERAVVNIVTLPEWVAVRAALLTALTPYADARLAVAAALASVEASPAIATAGRA